MSRGIIIFGINNSRIEYIQLAMMCAGFIRKNMPGTNICVITDEDSISQYRVEGGQYTAEFNRYFDDVVLVKPDQRNANMRTYRDTRYHSFKDNFRNETRASVYDLSPYDETLVLDCDYLVCNDSLNKVWDSAEEVMINHQAVGLMHNPMAKEEVRLNPYGIKMYWATIIYFRKGEKARALFDLVEHVRENWEFYKLTYDFPGHLYRNDYAFSIAIHILNGFAEENFVSSLPDPVILSGYDFDQFYGITDAKTLHFFANDMKENWKFYATRTHGLNVHCMNKISLINNMKEIMEVLSE